MNTTDIKSAFDKAITATAQVTQTNLTADDNTVLRVAPTLVGMYVALSSPSGLIGMAKEAGSTAHALMDAGKAAGAGSLIHTLFGAGPQREDQAGMMKIMQGAKSQDEMKANLLGEVKKAVGALASKGNAAEVTAYKSLLLSVAQKVAEASKEGGFLGIGGTLVNDAEKQAIEDVKKALG